MLFSVIYQYMVAIPLLHGRLTTDDYSDSVAADPAIDELRAKMVCVEDKHFSEDYHNPESRSIGNAISITLNDGTKLDEVEVKCARGPALRRDCADHLLRPNRSPRTSRRGNTSARSQIQAPSCSSLYDGCLSLDAG